MPLTSDTALGPYSVTAKICEGTYPDSAPAAPYFTDLAAASEMRDPVSMVAML